MITPIPLIEENCAVEIERMQSGMQAPDVSYRTWYYFCTLFRRMGVAHFFSTGATFHLFESLFNSGRAYLFFLKNSVEEKQCISKADSFLDAVACRDIEGARLIAGSARRRFNSAYEYEEDFLYFDTLMNLFFRDVSDEQKRACLEHYDTVRGGLEEVRFNVCVSLFEQDQVLFDETLYLFLDEAEETFKKQVEDEVIDPDHAATTAKLSIEGLALVVLAERAGLSVAPEYLYIPSAVMSLPRSGLDPEGWMKPIRSDRWVMGALS